MADVDGQSGLANPRHAVDGVDGHHPTHSPVGVADCLGDLKDLLTTAGERGHVSPQTPKRLYRSG
jgi:hypothetical protein